MKLKKVLSKGLILGILFNNMGYSFANTKSLDGRYETFEGNNITIDNILEEDKVDVEIEGNTLVNLVLSSYGENKNNHATDGRIRYLGQTFLEPNKIYTIITTIDNIQNGPVDFHAEFDYIDGTSDESFELGVISENGIYKRAFTVPKNTLNMDLKIGKSRIEAGQSFSTEKIMLLEGDWTNKEIPTSYFEGMKSVGELEDNKIEVILQNKNLFDINNMLFKHSRIQVIDDTSIRIEDINPKSYNYYGKTNIEEFLEDNKTYTINATYDNETYGNYGIDVIRKSDNYRVSVNLKTVTIDKSKYTYTLKFYSNRNDYDVTNETVSVTYSNIQLEKDELRTNFVKPEINKKEILLNEPLRGLSNGIKDKITKRNGQWVIERRLDSFLLNEENFVLQDNQLDLENTLLFRVTSVNNVKPSLSNYDDSDIISDKFISSPSSNATGTWGVDREGISVNSNGHIHIRINKSRLKTEDEKGFKDWLSQNPVTIIYSLNEPVYDPLTIDLSLKTYLDITHIFNNSTIPCDIKIAIDRSINKAVEAIKLAQNNPTIDNISKARMWINLLKESSNKDNLQNQVDNIIKIEDLEMELKKATSNMDIYIKSQNGLSMSLSTNSIVFDEFDSTEDMEKLNAVNLTVNSSLPYQLNSYMMTELKNKDNTEIIPKELFNIRLNGETDYKAFNNINEKLILKENCQKGNNNQFSIDLILKGSLTHKADVYKTTLKFEAEQK